MPARPKPANLTNQPFSNSAEPGSSGRDDGAAEPGPVFDEDGPRFGPKPSALLSGVWLTTEALAAQLGRDPSTLRRWRTSRPPQGPPFVRMSDRGYLYNAADVEEWLLRKRVDPSRAAAS